MIKTARGFSVIPRIDGFSEYLKVNDENAISDQIKAQMVELFS